MNWARKVSSVDLPEGTLHDRSEQATIEVAFKKRLGAFQLDVNFAESGFICLAGKNGCGKTTFMKVIAGLVKPDEGHVWINGVEHTDSPVEKRGVVLVTPESALPNMEVGAHLEWGARIRGRKLDRAVVEKTKKDLGVNFAGKVGKLSLGMRERVALATALLAAPSVVLVDEAFANLHEKREFVKAYRGLAAESKVDVLFSTQDESDGELAQHLYSMEQGHATKRF